MFLFLLARTNCWIKFQRSVNRDSLAPMWRHCNGCLVSEPGGRCQWHDGDACLVLYLSNVVVGRRCLQQIIIEMSKSGLHTQRMPKFHDVVNKWDTGDLRRHRPHCDVTVMFVSCIFKWAIEIKCCLGLLWWWAWLAQCGCGWSGHSC